MKPFFCKLTGGHIYHDADLVVLRCDYSGKVVLKNRCLRCGKEFKFEIRMKPVIEAYIKDEERRKGLYSAMPKERDQENDV